jgi:hypothetical protein
VRVGRAREERGVGAWPIRYSYLGDASTEEEPGDLCITQARYTQLHRSINYSKVIYLLFVGRLINGAVSWCGSWFLAVALAVADAPRFARRASRGDSAPIAFDVHFKNRRMMDKPVDSCKRHGGVTDHRIMP